MDRKIHINRTTTLTIATHAIILGIVFVLPEIIFSAAIGHRPDGPRYFEIYTHTLLFIATFYINYFILVDKLLFKNHIIAYIITALLFAALMVALSNVAQHLWINVVHDIRPHELHKHAHHGKNFFIAGIVVRDYVMHLLTIGLSIAVKMGLRWAKFEKMNERIISEQREMELHNLKNQLNPHFLFNTLNNIYALTSIDTTKAQDAILQLSKLLRYTLYENDNREVELNKELLFVRSYIELMKLRLSDNNKLHVEIYDGPTDGLTIAPMMFIALIENAFKHGVSGSHPSNIDIRISLKDSIICCHVENSLFQKQKSDKSGSGIGLSNLTRQLSLLYENKHSYHAGIAGKRYVAELTIDLNKTAKS